MEPKKKKRTGKISAVLMALLLGVVIVVNVACGMYQNVITQYFSKAANIDEEAIKETREKGKDLVERTVGEGSVLLRNQDQVLPLGAEERKVNCFGWASVDPMVWGGLGSGAGGTEEAIDYITGLKNNGFTVNEELVDFYEGLGYSRENVDSNGTFSADYSKVEAKIDEYPEDIWKNAREYSDVAIVMFSRMGNEGDDLPTDMSKWGGKADEHYLELGENEEALLDKVAEMDFEKVILLINSSYPFELGFMEEKGVDAALWIGGPGETGMNAVAKILKGEINPSGRTADTYAYDLTSAPSYENWGDFHYADTEYEAEGYNGKEKRNLNFVEEAEGIYIGYRYYETRWIDNATGACDEKAYRKAVQYPFGYGLSYTTFKQEIKDFQNDGKEVHVKVTVTNTGDMAGKDVVQIYLTPPYYEGGIEKAHVNLVDFDKTDILEPGESQDVELSFKLEDVASFDYKDKGYYVLDEGTYEVKLMKNAHEVIDSRKFNVDETIVYDEENKRESDLTVADRKFEDAQGEVTYLSRADWEGTWPHHDSVEREATQEIIDAMTTYEPDPELIDEDAPEIVVKDNGLELKDLVGLEKDDPKWELLLEQLSVEDMQKLISLGGYATQAIESVGKPYTIDLDGPTGVKSLVNETAYKTTLYPTTVVLASTWNPALAEEFGDVYSQEIHAWGISGLYGPSMNLHRSPFGGRNYEYYSEDSKLTAKMAGNVVKKFMENGNAYCYIKHFAGYEQTHNGFGLAVWTNEQALRELYFRPFETCVKEAGARAVMSSYNRLGTTWTGGNYTLLTEVLGGEWGFEGMIITDWFTAPMDADQAIYAGNDLMLCTYNGAGNDPEDISNSGQQAMRRACHDILYTVANSNATEFNYMGPKAYWLYALIAADIVIAALELIFWIRRFKKTRK